MAVEGGSNGVAVIGVGNVPSNYCLQDCVPVYVGVVWKLSSRRLWGVRGAPPVRCVPDLQHSCHIAAIPLTPRLQPP
jgi:hypothetical protein